MSQIKENAMENKRIYKKSVPPEHFGRKEIHDAAKDRAAKIDARSSQPIKPDATAQEN